MRVVQVKNIDSPRTGKPLANEYVIVERDSEGERRIHRVSFQSYQTTVAIVDFDDRRVIFGSDWNCSITTGRYRNEFFAHGQFDALVGRDNVKSALDRGFVEGPDGEKWSVELSRDF